MACLESRLRKERMSEINENEDSGSKEKIIVIIGQLKELTTSEYNTYALYLCNDPT